MQYYRAEHISVLIIGQCSNRLRGLGALAQLRQNVSSKGYGLRDASGKLESLLVFGSGLIEEVESLKNVWTTHNSELIASAFFK